MKRLAHTPHLLPEVLDAIYDLREVSGSNTAHIVKRIEKTIHNKPRNLTSQVQSALNHGLTSDILRKRAGKFRINTQKFLEPLKDCALCRKARQNARRRRRRRAPRKGRSRRGRRRANFELSSKLAADASHEVNSREIRYARRQHGSRRSVSRHRRPRYKRVSKSRRVDDDIKEDKKPEKRESPKGSKDDLEHDLNQEVIYPDDHNHGDDDLKHAEGQCDDEHCLCNVKQETDDVSFDRNM